LRSGDFLVSAAVALTRFVRPLAKRVYLMVTPLLMKERRLLRSIDREQRVVILNFHQVMPTSDPHAGPLAPERFDELIGFIARTFEIRTLQELRNPVASGRRIAVLSFDDGYHDFVEYAMPILTRRGIRVNHNVIPSAILGTPPFTVALADLLRASPDHLLRTLRLPGFGHQLHSASQSDRGLFQVRLANYLKLRSRTEREPLWDEVRHHLRDVEVKRPTRMMDVSDLRQAAALHEIGVHSYEHETMAYETDEYFSADLDRCAQFFDEVIKLPLDIYAFPNGLARQEQVERLLARRIRDVLLVGDRYSSQAERTRHRFNIAAPTITQLRLQVLGFNAARFP
jgi:peptidoglycan/xylan/chitin deacetylase (PgdA/CDA1 family)